MTDQKLLDFKKRKKAKNPKFLRQDSYKKKRLSKVWRKPRGWDSKQRKRMQRQAIVEPGYGSPRVLRGIHKSGLSIVVVKNIKDIKNINPKENGAIISGKMGLKKKLILIEELIKNKVTILNIKNPEEYMQEKKKLRETRKGKQEGKKEKIEQKKQSEKKDESIEDKLSEEEKKKLEKKEIDKLLTKKF